MDQHLEWAKQLKVERTIKNLKKNNIEGFYAKDKSEALDIVKSLINEGDTVSVGGSMTLFEMGLIDFLREGNYQFLDRYKEGLNRDELQDIYRETFSANAFFASVNAITEEGTLYNIDGTGNRVAAMIYGPDKVIILAGINKIVKDETEAMNRARDIAAPTNAHRLSRKTPCVATGCCMDCESPERICANYVMIKRQMNPERMKVILIDNTYGY